MLTSTPAVTDRHTRRTFRFVYGIWALMTLQALVFVVRYAHVDPIVDEWEFIPAFTGEEPYGPWLWKLHNEHRFPLPRLFWLPLTQLAGRFDVGCYVTLLSISLFTLFAIRLARQLRGRLHFADAFFPLSLLHTGHYENMQMGYQICFMLVIVLAGLLLWVILKTDRSNLLRRGVQAGFLTALLLGCGAGGLAFGPFMAIWMIAVAIWSLTAKPRAERKSSLFWVALLTAIIPVYIGFYLQGYHRPSHHDDPLAIWGSTTEAAWQAGRSALQALSMAFGPGAIGLWPYSAFAICLIAVECAILLVRVLIRSPEERPRALGILLFLGAVAFMAFGIGWGRCTFLTKEDLPGYMGLSSRYCWIMWPALGAIYYMGLIYGKDRWAKWAPIALFSALAAMLPFNVGTGYFEGEHHRKVHLEWVQSVREGLTDEELIAKYYPGYNDDLKERMRIALPLLRKNRFQYYRPLSETLEEPTTPTNGFDPRFLLIPVAGFVALLVAWRFYGLGRAIQAERARELFRLQHERWEKLFFEKAAATGLPRGLRWVGCVFANEVEFARERQTKRTVALVPVTIQFEAVEGGDMEGLPAVPIPRSGSAVLHFIGGEWTTTGRVVFNLLPPQVLDRFASDYEPLHSAT